jgi:DNA-directed RNA polymerase subunit alpha
MRVRWRGLELPARIEWETETLTDRYGKLIAEPFERGYGTTVGNSLRRVLLSSLEGSSVVNVKFDGVLHEFSTIPGVVEDVTDIVLNIKRLVIRSESDDPKVIRIDASKKGVVTGADIITDATVEVVNKDLVIATLSEDAKFRVEMTVKRGRGYITAEENSAGEQVIGFIPVDSVFSPVVRVRYSTENTRVGQKTNYDRLIMEIWTNGTITSEMAVVEAAKILRKHLNVFIHHFEAGDELQEEGIEAIEEVKPGIAPELLEKLSMSIDELDLSVRARNCLEAVHLKTVGDLVTKAGAELLKVRNFGKTSLAEVETKLSALGLSLGMDVEWPRQSPQGE